MMREHVGKGSPSSYEALSIWAYGGCCTGLRELSAEDLRDYLLS